MAKATTITKPKALDILVQEYFANLVPVTLADKHEELERAIANQILRYEMSLNSVPTSNTNVPGTAAFYNAILVQHTVFNNLSQFKMFNIVGDEIMYLQAIKNALDDGYTIPADEDGKRIRHLITIKPRKSFVLLKPESQIQSDKQSIRSACTAAMQAIVDLENAELTSTTNVLKSVEAERIKQELAYTTALKNQAIEAAKSAAEAVKKVGA